MIPTALGVIYDGGGSTSSVLNVTLQNAYIHDSGFGLAFVPGYMNGIEYNGPAYCDVNVLNDTFERDDNGVSNSIFCSDPSPAGPGLTCFNNLLVDNTTALALGPSDVSGYEALYGNTTNFALSATAGPGTIESNPLLDTSTTPPGLLAGSPCRGAANAAVAPNHDFWGRPRGSSVDIGAVQSSP